MNRVVRRAFFLLAYVTLLGCSQLPEWAHAPDVELSVRVHNTVQQPGYLDEEGVCHLFFTFSPSGLEQAAVAKDLERCEKGRGGKGFSLSKKPGVENIRLYSVPTIAGVGGRKYSIDKLQNDPRDTICIGDCGYFGIIFEGDGWCGIVYVKNEHSNYNKHLAHELLHAAVGEFHKRGGGSWQWLPETSWKKNRKCNVSRMSNETTDQVVSFR